MGVDMNSNCDVWLQQVTGDPLPTPVSGRGLAAGESDDQGGAGDRLVM